MLQPLARLLRDNEELQDIVSKGKHQLTNDLRSKAKVLINKILQVQTHQSELESSIIQSIEEDNETNFYALTNLQTIANGLDFNIRPRMSRDGTTEINVHNRKQPNEILKYQIFDLESKVLEATKMAKGLKERVREFAFL